MVIKPKNKIIIQEKLVSIDWLNQINNVVAFNKSENKITDTDNENIII